MADDYWKGRVTVVTGGASGIGQATARGFAALGARVAILDLDDAAAGLTLEEIRQSGGEAEYHRCDVTDESSVEDAISRTLAAWGRIDAAHNNVGISPDTGFVTDCPRDVWDKVFAVNVTGVWLCMKHELKAMQAAGCGAIVNTGSTSSLRADPGISAYVASKHALVGLTKSAALENAEQGIRVNLLCPGATATPMLERKADDGYFVLDDFVQAKVPMQRLAQPSEMAEMVIWACSDKASYLTGAVLAVDGGMVAA